MGRLPYMQETPPRAWGRGPITYMSPIEGRNTPTGVGKRRQGGGFCEAGWKHPHGRGEEFVGEEHIGVELGNTPTGVGKSFSSPGNVRRNRKHPHGRGEEALPTLSEVPDSETPPRAWRRGRAIQHDRLARRNTPTGVGKSPRPSLLESVQQKHPHGRGEEVSRFFVFCFKLETSPRAWGRAIHPDERNLPVGNTPTGVGKRAHSSFKQFEYYSIFFSFVKEPGSVCADFSIISCSPDMDVKSFAGMPFA